MNPYGMEESLRLLERWMELMPKKILDQVPIINLAIPGSHNSMSYGINAKSNVSSDGDLMVQILNNLTPAFTYRWFKDQDHNAMEQLMRGIRYFDLRVCRAGPNMPHGFYFSHAFMSVPIEQPFASIETFLENHPKELLIMDFQHFYDFTPEDHHALRNQIVETFGHRIIGPRHSNLVELTLNRAFSLRKQIVVIYRSENCYDNFYPGELWPTPWPNTTNARTLTEFLDRSLENRNMNIGHVCQCVFTPTFEFVANNLDISMVDVADNVYRSMRRWISHQAPGNICTKSRKPKVNVVIADFINLNNSVFCRHIIKLNERLL